MSDHEFHASASTSTTAWWIHIVLNFIGPENGEGIKFYLDGMLTGSDDTGEAETHTPGNGRVVLGRVYTDEDDLYGGVALDELLFFNQTLSEQEIMQLV